MRKINIKNRMRFIKSPKKERRGYITKVPAAFRQREHLSTLYYGAGVTGVLVAVGCGVFVIVGVGENVAVGVGDEGMGVFVGVGAGAEPAAL